MEILICDDDRAILERLKKIVSEYFDENNLEEKTIIRTFENVFKLRDYAASDKASPDIIIMDINIDEYGEVDGIDITKELLESHFCNNFIFCTGKSSVQERIFDVNPIYVIFKPIKKNSVFVALEKAEEVIKVSKNKIVTIKAVDSICRIAIDEIRFLESQGRYVKIHLKEEDIITINKLSNILEILGKDFIQSHKSYIINKRKIKYYNDNKCFLYDRTEIPVSRKFRNIVKEALFDKV